MAKGILRIKLLGDASDLDRTLTQAGAHLDGFGKKAALVGAALGTALTGAGIALGRFALQSAVQIDEAMDTIRVGTGLTGTALDQMGESFKTVFRQVPASADQVGMAIADLNSRLDVSGGTLETLATKTVLLSKITKEDLGGVIAGTTRVFGDWSIASKDQADALDYMFRVSQSTGIGVTDLSQKVVQFGAPLRQLGFDFETSAAMIGKFEKEGVNIETVLAGMKVGLSNFAKAGKDPEEALVKIVEQIKNAGSQAEANKLAIEVFGRRAGPDMAAAIREGRLELGDLLAQLQGGTETIDKAALATYDFGEKWTMFKNKVAVALEPLGSMIMEALGALVEKFSEYLPQIEEFFGGFVAGLTGKATEVNGALGGIGSVLGALRDLFGLAWPAIQGVMKTFIEWLSGEEGQSLINTLLQGINTVVSDLQSVFEKVWPAAQQAVKLFIEFFAGETGQAVIKGLIEVLGKTLDALGTVFEKVWPLAQQVIETFIKFWNGPAGQAIIKTLITGISTVLETMEAVFKAVWPAVQTVVEGFIGFFDSDTGQHLIASLLEALSTLVTTVGSVFAEVFGKLAPVLTPLIKAAVAVIKPLLDIVVKLIDNLLRLFGLIQSEQMEAAKTSAAEIGGYAVSGTGHVIANKSGYAGYQHGGLIPGAGPVPVLAHGGEYVLTKGDTELMRRLTAGLSRPSLTSLGGVTIYITGQGAAAGEAAADALLTRLAAAGVRL